MTRSASLLPVAGTDREEAIGGPAVHCLRERLERLTSERLAGFFGARARHLLHVAAFQTESFDITLKGLRRSHGRSDAISGRLHCTPQSRSMACVLPHISMRIAAIDTKETTERWTRRTPMTQPEERTQERRPGYRADGNIRSQATCLPLGLQLVPTSTRSASSQPRPTSWPRAMTTR